MTPTTPTTVEVWDAEADDWAPSSARRVPMGYELGEGVYRIKADVGETDRPPHDRPPHDVQEAFRRLAFYSEQTQPDRVGAKSYTESEGDLSLSVSRPANAMAMAMQNSGAADMLRYYRRAM